MKIINKKKFTKTALDKNIEAFIIYITSPSLNLIPIYSARKAQKALLVVKKIKIPTKYSDLFNNFLEKKALVLPKVTKLNQYAIKLQKD